MPAATGAVLEQHRGTGPSSDPAASAGEPRLSAGSRRARRSPGRSVGTTSLFPASLFSTGVDVRLPDGVVLLEEDDVLVHALLAKEINIHTSLVFERETREL